MKKAIIAFPLLLAAAAPAHATSGMVCRTSGRTPVEVSLVIGNTVGSPLVSGRLMDGRKPVEVRAVQWWLDGSELRLLLVDPNAMREELLLNAKKSGRYYDGTVRRGGVSRWVRCREG